MSDSIIPFHLAVPQKSTGAQFKAAHSHIRALEVIGAGYRPLVFDEFLNNRTKEGNAVYPCIRKNLKFDISGDENFVGSVRMILPTELDKTGLFPKMRAVQETPSSYFIQLIGKIVYPNDQEHPNPLKAYFHIPSEYNLHLAIAKVYEETSKFPALKFIPTIEETINENPGECDIQILLKTKGHIDPSIAPFYLHSPWFETLVELDAFKGYCDYLPDNFQLPLTSMADIISLEKGKEIQSTIQVDKAYQAANKAIIDLIRGNASTRKRALPASAPAPKKTSTASSKKNDEEQEDEEEQVESEQPKKRQRKAKNFAGEIRPLISLNQEAYNKLMLHNPSFPAAPIYDENDFLQKKAATVKSIESPFILSKLMVVKSRLPAKYENMEDGVLVTLFNHRNKLLTLNESALNNPHSNAQDLKSLGVLVIVDGKAKIFKLSNTKTKGLTRGSEWLCPKSSYFVLRVDNEICPAPLFLSPEKQFSLTELYKYQYHIQPITKAVWCAFASVEDENTQFFNTNTRTSNEMKELLKYIRDNMGKKHIKKIRKELFPKYKSDEEEEENTNVVGTPTLDPAVEEEEEEKPLKKAADSSESEPENQGTPSMENENQEALPPKDSEKENELEEEFFNSFNDEEGNPTAIVNIAIPDSPNDKIAKQLGEIIETSSKKAQISKKPNKEATIDPMEDEEDLFAQNNEITETQDLLTAM